MLFCVVVIFVSFFNVANFKPTGFDFGFFLAPVFFLCETFLCIPHFPCTDYDSIFALPYRRYILFDMLRRSFFPRYGIFSLYAVDFRHMYTYTVNIDIVNSLNYSSLTALDYSQGIFYI